MHLTWLDNNSWLIEMGEQRILLDPWFVGPLVFGNLPWFFKGERRTPRAIPEHIDLILLSQGLEDHAHTPTLEQLDRSIPVVASPNAAKVVQGLGYQKVTVLPHGESFVLRDRVAIKAIPGSPVGPFLVENGYLLEDLRTGTSLYYEPHGYHSAMLQEGTSVDIIISPIINVELPFIGAILQGWDSVLDVVRGLKPQVLVPTAAGGEIEFSGVLNNVLQIKGSTEELRHQLEANNLATQLLEPEPGKRFKLELKS
ncbi:MBL fold metallo-hydrolase [Lusitaniella coriacea]|uniref:MBL fold metallo-hydrolase n=1 Tax=Lusitaniella coriacea TaxID=1983105 RepID=UPI003CF564F8